MNDPAVLYRPTANPRRTTLAGRTHAEVLELQQPARDDDQER